MSLKRIRGTDSARSKLGRHPGEGPGWGSVLPLGRRARGEGRAEGRRRTAPPCFLSQELAAEARSVSGRTWAPSGWLPPAWPPAALLLRAGRLPVPRVGRCSSVLGSGNPPGPAGRAGLKSNFPSGLLFPRSTSRTWSGSSGPTR